ncbi:CRAL-TRIO domain-containing protein [Dipodascopsis uninucleata]
MTPEQKTAFDDFIGAVPDVVKDADYSELYGHDLSERSLATDTLIYKFLIANKYVVPDARKQLLDTLQWRKEFRPLAAAFEETHDSKFDGLGYITESPDTKEIITWNLYGQAAGKPEIVFGDVDAFLRWRIGVMERGLQMLDFASDRTQISQVHDYANVSFLRMDPNAKNASKVAVSIFQKYYPELLGKKYFINVPLVMGWMFTAMKLIVSRDTMSKFVVLSYGSSLVDYAGKSIPTVYGGQGPSLKEQDLSASIKPPAGFEPTSTISSEAPVAASELKAD